MVVARFIHGKMLYWCFINLINSMHGSYNSLYYSFLNLGHHCQKSLLPQLCKFMCEGHSRLNIRVATSALAFIVTFILYRTLHLLPAVLQLDTSSSCVYLTMSVTTSSHNSRDKCSQDLHTSLS